MKAESGRLARDGAELAWRRTPGRGPTTVFLPGFRSDMNGAKALEAEAFCRRNGIDFLAFDYSGHGASGGRFEDGTITRWRDDALHVVDALAGDDLVLLGSSMGGWLALLVALARPERVVGLVGIAAAPDFTEALMWAAMTDGEREIITRTGVLLTPSAYGEPVPVTLRLIEDGRRHLLMDAPIAVHAPVRLLQRQRDAEVPWQTSVRLAERLTTEDVQLTLVKDGDHRLSRPDDLALLRRVLGAFLLEDGA